MAKNNLFDFATSELSQDAFICWLLSFAKEKHLGEDIYLTECAKKLLQKMVPEETEHIVTDIKKQYNNIDVLVEVNDKYSIIIEDKTFSNVHNDQINEYEKILQSEGRQNIKCVYYKIVEQAHDEKTAINIKRKDLIDTFSEYIDKTKNVIFRDYYEYLLEIDEDVNSYKNKSIKVWREEYNHAYKGFFTHLIEEKIIQTNEDDVINGRYNWKYVSNPSGGFWCLWWYSIRDEKLAASGLKNNGINEMYLQIEDNIIAVKLVGDKNFNQIIREEMFNFCNNFCKKEPVEFEKKKFRKGEHMTVGYIEYDEGNYQKRIELMQNLMQSIVCERYQY